MKEGWEIKKLGDVGTFQRGGNFLKSDFVRDGYPCIHYGQIHMRFGVVTTTHLSCIPESLALSKGKIAHKGDVIIAITSEDVAGSCKGTAWMGDYDIAIGAHAAIYHHCLNPLYVSYYLKSQYFNKQKEAYTHGFKVIEIKPSDIAKITIPIPSLSEQQRIVDILDKEFEKIDRLKSNAELNLRHANDLFQAALKKELEPKEGWLNYRINEICKVSPSKSEVKKKKLKENDIVSFLPMEDMTIGIKNVIPSIIKPFGEVSGSYTYFEDDDVLLAKVTPCFENGKLGIARELKNGVGYGSSEFIVFRVVKEKVLPDFIYYCLQEPFFKQEGKRRMIGACGLKRLPKDYVKEKVLGVPSIHQQHLIVSTLDNLSSKCKVLQDNYNKTLSLCDDLKQSLLRKAFNGEL